MTGTGDSRTGTAGLALLSVPDARGCLILTACPGGWGAAAWSRPALAADLATIRRAGAGLLVTLMEAGELAAAGLPPAAFADGCAALGMAWLHLPIRDMDVPDQSFEQSWQAAGTAIRSQLGSGSAVAIHCRAGLGRTGMIAARLLMEAGMPARPAIAAVRGVRPGAIETTAQEAYLAALEGRGIRAVRVQPGQ